MAELEENVIHSKDLGHSVPALNSGNRPFAPKLELNAERQVMMAWERFVTGESLADMAVSTHVLSSWQRSALAGVAPSARLAPLAAYGKELEQLRHNNHDLLWAAKSLFLNSAQLLERSGSIMLLTDPNGIVLEAVGDPRTLDAGQDIQLVEGGNWHESVVGTNGIGTALAMRRPVQVHAAEHFCEGIKGWTCTAAPVFFPGTEKILGAIDISGPPSTYQGSNLVLAMSMAHQIEAALNERTSREHIHLLEASLKLSGANDAAAMVVLDRNAKVIYMRGNLQDIELRMGACLPGLQPGSQVQDWARILPEALRPEWLHPVMVNSTTIGALLVVPKRARAGIAALSMTDDPSSGSEVDSSRSDFASMVGQSTALRTAKDKARQLSGHRVAVLIQGETGVGKELFARAIHGSGPFITFNCGATTKELIGSELFGHVRGAYTGATNEGRAGRFELAHGGTLCLDEVGDMPLELQPVLLRVLEESIVYRLGEAKPRRVNVRLLAMTNLDLLAEVDAGRFRRDLYHRISVTRIRVPPLRERGLDIDLLTEHFNHELAMRHAVPNRSFGPDVMALMRLYPWPGNVRELRNVVESLLLSSRERVVRCDELPAEIFVMTESPVVMSAPKSTDTNNLEESERQAIVRVVQNMHGNLAQAARALGISRSTLYRKVERYHLEGIVGVAPRYE